MKVFLIIPIYNTENYITECIESVLKQSYTDFELLLINDGSTDKSAPNVPLGIKLIMFIYYFIEVK